MKVKTSKVPLRYTILDESVNVNTFDCGEEELNAFLMNLAPLYQRRHFGVTIVSTDSESRLIGFYTLCPASIQRESLPDKMLTGPRPNPLPAFRLCRLAIDKRFQGKGYGKMLFMHALKKCLDQAKQIGGSVIIIDAKHELAKKFYERYGFIPLPENPLTLIQTIKFIEHHFEQK